MGTQVNLETVFPGYPQRVFAHWFTQPVRIPQGRLLEYVHAGYASRYERDLIIHFEQGVVIDRYVRENGAATLSSPEGYGIGALTTFPRADG